MGIDVSSWFIDQLYLKTSKPKISFYIGTSDHAGRVINWPKIKTDVEKILPSNVSVTLANEDGIYNDFYSQAYTMNTSCYFQFGFTHPESGDELYTVYRGQIKKVNFQGNTKLSLNIYNKFFDVSKIEVGETDAPASMGSRIPSEIAWTVCTCYGQLANIRSSANPDINYDSFLRWAETFSQDSVIARAHFTGEKVTEALGIIAKQTDSYIFIDGNGKIVFERFTENSSLDFALEEGQYSDLKVSVDGISIINKQTINFHYFVDSDSWARQISAVNTTSVNSYGLQEETIENDNVWYVNCVDADTQANRILSRWSTPPRKFELTLPFIGFHREPADTLRFVNSFFAVDSSQGWRIASKEISLNPKKMFMKFSTNEGFVANAFYLDVHFLDGDEFLL